MTTETPRARPGDGRTDPLPQAQDPTGPPVVVPRELGGYELLERVGEGGMGVVWRATDRHGREVAIKVLRPHIAHDEQARERLRREVHTLARVHHPRVAAVIDADVDGPAPFIVTDFVPGPPLDEVVDREGPLRGEDLLRLARGLAAALRAIHDVGIVHRDLKPGNVLMVRRGERLEPVVIDFGIAQVADDVRLTSTGLVMGTPGYLSPEVVEGGEVGPATDWWGWAATLAYAASGHPPFGRGPVTVVLDRVTRGRLQLVGVDPRLRPLLAAALDPSPGHRPDEHQVLDALERYARDEDVTGALPLPAVGVGHDDARSREGSDATRLHDLPDATRVAPQGTVARTRMTPRDASSPAPGWREPGAVPASWEHGDPGYGLRPVDPGYGRPVDHAAVPQQPSPSPQPFATPEGQAWGGGRAAEQGQAGPHPGQLGPGGHPYDPAVGARPGGSAYPVDPSGQDPRIGRSARSGTLAAMLIAFAGLASLAPLAAWGLYALWGLLARTLDRSLTGLVLRRHEVGHRRSDVPLAVLAAPLHLVGGVLSTVLSLLLPLAIAAVIALVASGLVTTTEVLAGIGPQHPLAIGLGSLIGGWLGWWGLGSTSLRRGSRTVVRGMVPAGAPAVVAVLVCLAAGAGLVLWALQGGDRVSWWPLPPGTNPLQLLPFSLP